MSGARHGGTGIRQDRQYRQYERPAWLTQACTLLCFQGGAAWIYPGAVAGDRRKRRDGECGLSRDRGKRYDPGDAAGKAGDLAQGNARQASGHAGRHCACGKLSGRPGVRMDHRPGV